MYLPIAINPKSKHIRVSKQIAYCRNIDTYFMCKFPVLEIIELKRWLPRSWTIQGQPRSTDMVPIDKERVFCNLISVDHIVVSVTIFEIFDIKF